METKRYTASGGIIIRGGQALLLHKHKKDEYVLPKGHVEPGETLEAAALREAREETGFANLRLLDSLGTLHSHYEDRGYRVERDETYFVMQLLDDAADETRDYDDAQHDRDTFNKLWLPLPAAAARLTYEPARTFMQRASAWLQSHPQAGLT
jgi:8-oxo-dGTP pyrophosphatase MutT (NUDIX family)